MTLPLLYQLQGGDYGYLSNLDYRVAVVDMDEVKLTSEQNQSLNAQGKITFTYLSIGEAEDYRDYWIDGNWSAHKPSFVMGQDPDWPGCYITKFWDPTWQSIMMTKVAAAVNAGYDGLYLDLADGKYLDLLDTYGNAAVPGFNGTVDQLRQAMVDFVSNISDYAKSLNPDFKIIPQNGTGLLSAGEDLTVPNTSYISHIDGFGVEDLWFNDNSQSDWTPDQLVLLQNVLNAGKFVLATSYPTQTALQTQFIQNAIDAGFVPFVGNRALDGTISGADNSIAGQMDGKNIIFPAMGTTTVFVTVHGETFTTGFHQAFSGNVLANDHASNNGPLTLIQTTLTTLNGNTVTLDANGGFTFTPPANFLGTDSFVYTVSDSDGHTASGIATINVAAPAGALVGTNGDDKLTGVVRGNTTILCLDGNDTVTTGKGIATIIAGAGNHTFVINNAADTIELTSGTGHDVVKSSVSYVLPGAIEQLLLTGALNIDATGNDANNKLTGNAGKNMLYGGAGNDVLDGGMGHDILTGGSGADTFLFTSAANNTGKNADNVKDFNAGQGDVIDIHSILSSFNSVASKLSDFVQLTESNGNTLLNLDANGLKGGAVFVTLATLEGVTGLDAATLVAGHNLIVS